MVGAAATRRWSHPPGMGRTEGRRSRSRPGEIVCAAAPAECLLEDLPGSPDGVGWLLGHIEPEHPGLHPICEVPAVANVRAGSRVAADDDRFCIHRCCGY